MILISSAQQKAIDRAYVRATGLPLLLLMEAAGKAVADELLRLLDDRIRQPVLVLAGSGQNGGDAWVCARYLLAAGCARVRLRWLPGTEGSETAANRAAGLGLDLDAAPWNEADVVFCQDAAGWIVDGLYGCGFRAGRGAAPEFAQVASAVASARAGGAHVLAIDCPSGLDVDSGVAVPEAIAADRTLTFVRSKIGLHSPDGQRLAGDIRIDRIGVPDSLTDSVLRDWLGDEQDPATVRPARSEPVFLTGPAWLRQHCPQRPADGHKGTFGTVSVLAGAPGMAGAALLAAESAARSGAGLVRVATDAATVPVLLQACPELLVSGLASEPQAGAADLEAFLSQAVRSAAVLAGPGLGRPVWLSSVLSRLIAESRGLVLDADALNGMAGDAGRWWNLLRHRTQMQGLAPAVLTPHPGEFARLAPDLDQNDRRRAALVLAGRSASIVVLKGAATVIATPDGRCYLNPTGNSGLARGGSGDLLAGLISGLIAQTGNPEIAAVAGVWLHGRAADRAADRLGQRAMMPRDLLTELPGAFRDAGWELPGADDRLSERVEE